MSCNCHGKSGISVHRTSPYDQCTTCAKKHVVKAWNLFNLFTYTDDNRDVISGQLRLATDHLMYAHKDIALLARDLSIKILLAKDTDIADDWQTLLLQIRLAFNEDHPDVVLRLQQLLNTDKQE